MFISAMEKSFCPIEDVTIGSPLDSILPNTVKREKRHFQGHVKMFASHRYILSI